MGNRSDHSWRVILDRVKRLAREDGEFRAALRRTAIMLLADLERMEPGPSFEVGAEDNGLDEEVDEPGVEASGVAGSIFSAAAETTGQQAHAEPTAFKVSESEAAATVGAGVTAPAVAPAASADPISPAPEIIVRDVPRVATALRLGDGTLPVMVRIDPSDGASARFNIDRPRETASRRLAQSAKSAQDAYATAYDAPHAVQGRDLEGVIKRLGVKVRACRWAIQSRAEQAAGGAESETAAAARRQLIADAKALPDCWIWCIDPNGPPLPDDAELERIAGCYEALAAAANLIVLSEMDGEQAVEEAVGLLAEAQSAMRVALEWMEKEDVDQFAVFSWLRNATQSRHIYLSRYMRVDDPGDPAQWSQRLDRANQMIQQRQALRRRTHGRDQLLKKARYHALRLANDHGGEHDWATLSNTVEELIAEGMPASNSELRESIKPLAERIPEDLELGPGMGLVLSNLDAYLATQAQNDRPEAEDRAEVSSPDVQRVANLLQGRVLVLVGGQNRPFASAKLKRAFRLEAVEWLVSEEHESLETFEPAVARRETAVVLLAIRWSSHSYGELARVCTRYGKPFVRLPGGYNPEQVAAQILKQVGQTLESGVVAGMV